MTRADLAPGDQAVQAAHAAIAFCHCHEVHPDCTVVLLTVPDESALHDLGFELQLWLIPSTGFREPDLGGQLTAIATVESRLVKDLPLAFPPGGGETDG